MRILEITAFSAGFCGVWMRVKQEAELLTKKGNEVYVFSSNIKRGLGKIEYASAFDRIGKVNIQRFKPFGSFGENTFFWNFKKQALKLKPDIIICHAYRQYYSTKALKIARKLEIPCIIVTHAPFLEKKLRGPFANILIWIYDTLIGKKILNEYSKVFTISRWEESYLLKLGLKKKKIIYMPNGIPEEFFKIKPKRKKIKKYKEILFLSRISPIKHVECLIKSFDRVLKKEKNIILNLVGPSEEDYKGKIEKLISKLGLEKKIIFSGPIYNLKEKIEIFDNAEIYVLPSKREGIPQSIIEAMSREKIVISSNNEGGKELIQDKKTGYLFEIGNEQQLAEKILIALEETKENKKIAKEAKKFAKRFSWKKIINRMEVVLKKELKNNNAYKR